MLLISLTVSAQSDFDIAKEFMSKKGVKLVPNKRSTTRGTDVPYSIFNGENGKGFCIVVNGSIVGYDINNTISEDNMPCCLKEILLNNYSKTVKSSITRGGYTPDWWTPRNITPIEPLITTHWSYCSPYNDILQRNGICTVIAFCQLLHYFRVPQTFSDATSKDGELLPITMFNHDLMLDEYKNGDYTEEEAYEVAKFYYYYYNIDCYGLENVYGMKDICHFSDSKNYYAEIDKYLEEKIPIWVGGSVVDGRGHAFIIDGRDSEGRYHVNLGWGGGGDGYYVLSDSEEHLGTYNGDDDVLSLMSTCGFSIEIITPKLFSWSYTTDIYKPNFDVAKTSNTNVYNLQGVKVGNSLEGLPKGIYIQGGKKYVVK
jgi:hypothetical protein